MFNTKEVKTTNKNYISKYLNPGQHLVKINKITPKTASTGTSQLQFEVETEPVTTEGFVPAEGYTGQVGTVKTVYIANQEQEQQISALISSLADELGVREAVDSISADTIGEYAEQLSKIVCNGEYVYMTINGREYMNSNTGKKGTELQFPRFKTFASKQKVETQGMEKALAKPYLKPLPGETPVEPQKSEGEVW